MDRRLLFPALAATAWAQQQPAQPNVDALRDRVQRYYQMMVDKKFRQAEEMVATDSREDYYNGRKPDIKDFEIMSISLQDEMTAKVTVRLKVTMLMPGAGAQIFNMPTPTDWKIENGLWSWYIPAESKAATPFGKMKNNDSFGVGLDMKGAAPGGVDTPDLGALMSKVAVDKVSVSLSAKEPEQVVTITNGLPGPISVTVDSLGQTVKGISVDVPQPHADGGGKIAVRIRRVEAQKLNESVVLRVGPFNRVFNIQVTSE